jgi:hypothetical protein
MNRFRLSIPQIMFVAGTRAALAGGVGLLVSERLQKRSRRRLGWILAGFGALTTVPAALLLRRQREGSDLPSSG